MDHANNLKTATIDNSALNNILNSEECVSKIDKILAGNQIRLIISMDALNEAFGGENVDLIHIRLSRLYQLVLRHSPDKLILARGSYDWLTREYRSKGKLKNIPVLFNSQRWPGLMKIISQKDELAKFHARVGEARFHFRQVKVSLEKSDLEFKKKAIASKKMNDEELRRLLKNFKGVSNFSEISAFVKVFKFLSNGKAKIAFTRKNKDRYIFLKTYCSVLLIRSIGNVIENYTIDDEYKFLESIKRGNWYDLGALVQGVQLDFLITDDTDQRDFCNFLRERNIVKCCAIDSKEFLKCP